MKSFIFVGCSKAVNLNIFTAHLGFFCCFVLFVLLKLDINCCLVTASQIGLDMNEPSEFSSVISQKEKHYNHFYLTFAVKYFGK